MRVDCYMVMIQKVRKKKLMGAIIPDVFLFFWIWLYTIKRIITIIQ